MKKLQELQRQMLQLLANERWQLVQALLDSLKQEAHSGEKQRNLIPKKFMEPNLTKKYQ